MIKQSLFDGAIEVGISELSDGNMRFFGEGDEKEVILSQKRLGNLIGAEKVARIRTVYGDRKNFTDYNEVTDENFNDYSANQGEGRIFISDGLATKETSVGILLPLADCLGIVVFDDEQKIIGLLHAGRHNIEQDGPRKFINYFIENFKSNPEKIKTYFLPHAKDYKIHKLDNKNLSGAAKEQLIDAGISPENILESEIDTVSAANFPSHSSGDTNKRFAIVVKLA